MGTIVCLFDFVADFLALFKSVLGYLGCLGHILAMKLANLGTADLVIAHLGVANLVTANLVTANLVTVNLGSANLGVANLGIANLGTADLVEVRGFPAQRISSMGALGWGLGAV